MVMPVSKKFGMVDPVMLESAHIEHIIAVPAIRINDAIGDHLTRSMIGMSVALEASGIIFA
jgi:hypothetical protein